MDVEFYVGKFIDDERWRSHFTSAQQVEWIGFAEAYLRASLPDTLEIEYRRLRTMLNAGMWSATEH